MRELTALGTIGAHVRRLRDRHELTLDDIATYAREVHGLKWSTTRVRKIENGDGAATVETLVTLADVLTHLTGETVRAPDLLQSGAPVQIAPRTVLAPGSLPAALRGDAGLDLWDGLGIESRVATGGATDEHEALHELRRALGDRAGAWEDEDVVSAYRGAGLADRRAAERLGISLGRLVGLSLHAWGRLLSQESVARSGADATPQKRGRITRGLMDELSQLADHGDD